MGYDNDRLVVTARLSSHNSERDQEDRETWEEFKQVVDALSRTDRYKSVIVDVEGASWV